MEWTPLSSLGVDDTANLAHCDAVGRGVHSIAYAGPRDLDSNPPLRRLDVTVGEVAVNDANRIPSLQPDDLLLGPIDGYRLIVGILVTVW